MEFNKGKCYNETENTNNEICTLRENTGRVFMGMSLEKFLVENLEGLKSKGLYNEINILEGANGPEIKIGGRKLINLSSNNLCLDHQFSLINPCRHNL